MIVKFYDKDIIDDERVNFKACIYLAGPTRWNKYLASWRKESIEILKMLEFNGIVYAPEYFEDEFEKSYKEQAVWRKRALNTATTILFWIPKNYPIPYNVNAEFAYWLAKRKDAFLYGRETVNSNYKERMHLDWLYEEEKGCKFFDNLEDLIQEAVIDATNPKCMESWKNQLNERFVSALKKKV